ncbi:MAG TPA: ribosome assembly RNA-binding protein YhbY [Methanococcaceae archaeon]|nr:ribosome assembly RNA-binding protein YhbY [Methanococcaceae archaeon]
MEEDLQPPKRLTSKAKKILRTKSHSLSPVVWVGKEGVDKVIHEVKRQIKDKGLIKVKIRRTALEKNTRENIAKRLALEADAEVVSLVGNVITLFRPREGWKKYTTKKTKQSKYVKEFEKLKFAKKFRGA